MASKEAPPTKAPSTNLEFKISFSISFIIPFLAVSIQESLSPELIQGVLNYPKWFQLKGYYFIIFWNGNASFIFT